MNSIHIISKSSSIIDAIRRLNEISAAPLVLLVTDTNNIMCGTLTDGDIRRALLRGVDVNDSINEAMHRDFNFLRQGENDNVEKLQHQRQKKMKLVPVLDKEGHICEIINLEKYHTQLPVDAVLMAGGKGERLRPLTERTPKPLIKVGNKCIIDYNIDRLLSYGLKHLSVTVNYLGEQIEEHFSQERDGIKIQTVREPKYLGTIGGIKFVESFHNDTVLVMNSDIFTNIDYEDFFLHFTKNNAEMSVAAIPYSVSIPYGVLELDGRGIKGLVEKPKYTYYTNAGIYLIKKSALAEIPDDVFFNATDLIEKLISQNKTVIHYPFDGTWIDIGTPQEYQRAEEVVKHLKG